MLRRNLKSGCGVLLVIKMKMVESVLSNDGALCICALDETNTICGFSVGCLNSKGFHCNIVRENLISFMKCGVELLFTNPKSIIRLIKNFSKDPNLNDDGQSG